MEILDKINVRFKEAMKSRDEHALNAIRAIKSGLDYKKAEAGKDPDEAVVVQVIRKEAKTRRDSIDQFKQAGRNDLVEKEEAQLKIIEEFLPAEMDDAAIEAKVREIVAEMGVDGKSAMGKLMGRVMAELKGKADGGRVKQIVAKVLE